MTLLYHRSSAADAILSGGFRDSTGSYMLVGLTLTGVFVSDQPLAENEGARGSIVLELRLPEHLDIAEFELVEEGKPYREWCVPAAVLNQHAELRVVSQEELEER